MKRTSLLYLAAAFIVIAAAAVHPGAADVRDDVRQKGLDYAKPLEVIMVDGPLYVDGRPYYVADYVEPDSTVAASLVYDASAGRFTASPEIIQKVLATKDLKKLTVADPLFYAPGDPGLIMEASRYETQNVRNFASFSSITPEEERILEVFLADYETVMADVANTSGITEEILYPDGALQITYITSPPAIDVRLKEGFDGGRFSYEGFERLVSSYETLHHDYQRLSADLSAFAGGLAEYQSGAIIREKFDVQMTKESILREVALIEENGDKLGSDISLRRDILTYPYEEQIKEAQRRLGVAPLPGGGLIAALGGILTRLRTLVLGLFGMGALFLLAGWGRPPKKGLHTLIILIAAAAVLAPALSQTGGSTGIPTMEELISRKVGLNDTIPYVNHADLSNESVEGILRGFRLVLKGESVEVRGPYTHYGRPYYFFDIQRDGVSTGNGFLVDAERLRLVGDQRQAFQLLKTLMFADLLRERPLYRDADPALIEENGKATLESPLDLFLTNLSRNVAEGAALERELTEQPDFETLLNLTGRYVEGYILLQNIRQLVNESEAERLTGGFSNRVYLLDAYSRAGRGLSAEEFLQGRQAQYRGRTLNRLPLITQLGFMGLRPSKAQVAHDLTSDLIHDNPYLWRGGRVTDPNLFARLSFREGTYTVPKSIGNITASNTST
ncbi:MAG: hypothetical protein D6733_05575 [Methanobacteriota archaeon]|nr:MAG: hypothetical protein D6733_05575 [Euryarchaeota archaeon]